MSGPDPVSMTIGAQLVRRSGVRFYTVRLEPGQPTTLYWCNQCGTYYNDWPNNCPCMKEMG